MTDELHTASNYDGPREDSIPPASVTEANLVDTLRRAQVAEAKLREVRAALDAPTTEVKLEEAPEMPSKPAIGARVAWSELEDGCLYTKTWGGCLFLLVRHGVESVAYDPSDPDIAAFVGAGEAYPPFVHQGDRSVTLIARDLGSDPEEWRQAMRDYLAKEAK